MEKREQLGSRLGFIMISAGCAIGCGNVWKFPWMCGQNGGGGFMLIYLICLLILGLPVMTMEFSVGRAARTSPIYMYQKLEKPGHKWGIFGIVSLIGNITLMAFYTVVCGWLIYYFVKFLTGQNQSFGFTQMIQNPSVNVSYLLVTVIVAFLILSFDLQGGLERITKYMMTSLLVQMPVPQTMQPFFRDQPVSSRIMARIFSQTPRTVERAANTMNRKNSVPQMRPPAMWLKTSAMVSNNRLGPALTSSP